MPDLRWSASKAFLLGRAPKSTLKLPSSNAIIPWSGISRALIHRKKVVLPDPDGPSITTTLPL